MSERYGDPGRIPSPGHRSGWVIGGRYHVGSLLGRGGMADVFRAHDDVLSRDVALKVFVAGASDDLETRSQLEMRTLAGLNHPNLVTVYDAGVDGDESGRVHPYLVMELVTGPTLRQRIDADRLDPTEVAQLGIQVAGALSYIHQRGVVHRDVKPGNILLDTTDIGQRGPWTAKLTDFGIVSLMSAEPITLTGMTLGTPSYLSPEQARGERPTPASDLYSLGLVLVEGLTGARAVPEGDRDLASRRAPRVPTGYGPAWTHLLTAMLAADPAARPSASAVCSALAHIVDTPTQPVLTALDRLPEPQTRASIPSEATPPSARRRPRRTPLPAVVGAVAIAVVSLFLVAAAALRPATVEGTGSGAATASEATSHSNPSRGGSTPPRPGPPAAAVTRPAAPTTTPSSARPTTAVPRSSAKTSPATTAASTTDHGDNGAGNGQGNGNGKHKRHGADAG